jgi:death on curing protein
MKVRWLRHNHVMAIHERVIERHGGSYGLRDALMLKSALARPQNLAAYGEDADIFQLAAAYGWGITRNHPFIDGNKRAAFMAMYVFLGMNGFHFKVSEEEAAFRMLEFAAGNGSESDLADWLSAKSVPREK